MRPEGVKAKFPAPTHLIQARRHARANQGKTRHERKEQRQISANEVYADDRIENAEQNGEKRLAQEFEDGQEIIGTFGQRILESAGPILRMTQWAGIVGPASTFTFFMKRSSV